MCVAEASPGSRASSAWLFVFAIREVVGVLRIFAASPTRDADTFVPVVGATTAKNFAAVGFEPRG